MRRLIAVTAATLTLTLAGAGIAQAAGSGSSSPPKQPSAAAAPAPEERLLKNAVHADLVVMKPGGGTRTVTVDRGVVTAISADQISIERPDGVAVSKALTDKTVFNGTPKSALAAGAKVLVVSEGGNATRVVSKGAARQKLAKACQNAQRPAAKRLCARAGARAAARSGEAADAS